MNQKRVSLGREGGGRVCVWRWDEGWVQGEEGWGGGKSRAFGKNGGGGRGGWRKGGGGGGLTGMKKSRYSALH